MKYTDFVKKVAAEAVLPQNVVKPAIDAAMKVMRETVKSDGSIILNGVGRIFSKVRASKSGVHPVTKERIIHPEMKIVSFRASKGFKDYLNL